MHMRRGFFRLLLLATLGWVAFVAVNAWGTIPHSQMPVVSTQLSDYCRFSVRVTSDMSLYVVRYEAFAQYHRARTSLQGTRCRDFHQLNDDQVADIAGRYFIQWLNDQRLSYERQHNARLNAWIFNYLLHALAPPLFVWMLLLAGLWVTDGFVRREEA